MAIKNKGVEITFRPCDKLHLDTEEKADAMRAALAKRGHISPVKSWSTECKAWHVGSAGTFVGSGPYDIKRGV